MNSINFQCSRLLVRLETKLDLIKFVDFLKMLLKDPRLQMQENKTWISAGTEAWQATLHNFLPVLISMLLSCCLLFCICWFCLLLSRHDRKCVLTSSGLETQNLAIESMTDTKIEDLHFHSIDEVSIKMQLILLHQLIAKLL